MSKLSAPKFSNLELNVNSTTYNGDLNTGPIRYLNIRNMPGSRMFGFHTFFKQNGKKQTKCPEY